MAEYRATIEWDRGSAVFVDKRYSRGHIWQFDGAITVPASSSPYVVPLPQSVEEAVDPEEALVASLSSCHMLWFLSLAAGRGYVVDHYQDLAVGTVGRNAEGKMAMLIVTLRPNVVMGGDVRPSESQVADLHHEAHSLCYIANSVKSEVRCEPVISARVEPGAGD